MQKDDYAESAIYRIRHSVSHVLAQVVMEMFPECKLAIGPPTRDGFYYDFDLPRSLTPEDLEVIERGVKESLRQGHEFHRREVSREDAMQLFADQPFKLELIEEILNRRLDEDGGLPGEGGTPVLTTYRHGNFEDLCRGPHVSNTAEIDPEAVALLHVAGAYWRGDERRPMLQRIYGTAWATALELQEYFQRVEEARQRDHRVLGKRLDLFSISESVGPGLALWHPKGARVRYLAERFSQDAHVLNGYDWVYTPHIGRADLWRTSGHLEFFVESMFKPVESEGEDYYLKPMNCPFHAEIYKSRQRSYRDLPLRLAEFGSVYRYERSGVLHGLTRVRGFTQDDAHTFCLPSQIDDEISLALRFSLYVLRAFGLVDFHAYIATRPEGKAIGSEEDWNAAVETLRKAVEKEDLAYDWDIGGGAFYGPKIDLKLRDSLGREWQLSTVQFDFNLPQRFDLQYTGEDGAQHRPFMVHRALFGSAERFFAMLIEHYKGAFPLWLAPLQVVVIPIGSQQEEFAFQVASQLEAVPMRAAVDGRNERMQAKIRDFEMDKTPFALIVGKREAESGTVSVRCRDNGDLGAMSLDSFLKMTRAERAKGKAEKLPA